MSIYMFEMKSNCSEDPIKLLQLNLSLLYQTPILFVPPLVECFPGSAALVALHH